jgi:small-conductance mechanosensitive channel
MQNRSGLIRTTGIIALAFVAVVIVWYLLEAFSGGWVSSLPQKAAMDLQNIANNRGLYLGYLGVDILYNLGIFALGALFYLIFCSYYRTLALFGGLGFVTTGAIWLMMDRPAFAMHQLALEYSAASGAAAGAIAEKAAQLALWGAYSMAVPAILLALGLFCFGVLIIRSAAVNRLIGWLAVAAGIIFLASVPFTFQHSLVSDIAYYAAEFWILVMGLWLVVRGVKTA